MRHTVAIVLLMNAITAAGQSAEDKISGTYSDMTMELQLKADHTFAVNTPDFIFTYNYQKYQSEGTWVMSGDRVVLNPDKDKRMPVVSMIEKKIEDIDSVVIKINYETELYENEVMVKRQPMVFDLLTIFVNERKHYYNVVHAVHSRICSFSPNIKKQTLVNSANEFRIAKQDLKKIGVYTYGFEHPIYVVPGNSASNYFEIMIVQPVDQERMPRSKEVVIKGKEAFYYERGGKVITSRWPQAYLRKQSR